ncbi:IS110 family RNA-guided transposase [Telluribacter humicola]|uniref:IS110 family transposase n=1 Tax=Telluribacter humicola TaxID=1720261 RepID=UPI001A975599|nr:IS110 family transposase [Telluribacter humicola]
MNKQFFIGIDISMATLDAALCQAEHPDHFTHQQFDNTVTGYGKLLSWLGEHGAHASNSFLGMEHTGHYTLSLCCFLQENDIPYTLISPLHLKRSLGMARGKSDRIDAGRIAWFICLHQRSLTPIQLPSGCLLKLKNLLAFRDRLVKASTSLKNTLTDLKETSNLIDNTMIIKLSQKQQNLIEQQIAQIEKEMEATVKQDEQVLRHFQLVKSVVGVGMITAAAFLIYTQGFTAFDNGRQFACYAGVAPIEHSSGSSIRGKTRISSLGNKKMKALLSNCAAAAVQHDPQLKAYRSGGRYQRKHAEGKERLVILNAVKAKLINRVFAAVSRGTPYVPIAQYGQAA